MSAFEARAAVTVPVVLLLLRSQQFVKCRMVQMSPADQAVVKALPGNTQCCDCGMKNPQWASVSFGNVFCLECSGVHRYVVALLAASVGFFWLCWTLLDHWLLVVDCECVLRDLLSM